MSRLSYDDLSFRGRSTIIFDLMFSVLTPTVGTRRALIAEAYRRYGNFDVNPSDELLEQLILKHRGDIEPIKDDEEYWKVVNLLVLFELRGFSTQIKFGHRALTTARKRLNDRFDAIRDHEQISNVSFLLALDSLLKGGIDYLAAAKNIHEEIVATPAKYQLSDDMRQLLEDLRSSGHRLIILSNQRDDAANELLRATDARQYFDAIYTSEALGDRKPHRSMWDKLLALEDCTSQDCVHIGNSLNSDSGAAALGIPVLLLDFENRFKHVFGSTRARVPQSIIPDHKPRVINARIRSGLIRPAYNVPQVRSLLLG